MVFNCTISTKIQPSGKFLSNTMKVAWYDLALNCDYSIKVYSEPQEGNPVLFC